ncbi:MAG TPA: phosphosulfolactate synthase [Firmicutes bacterium]|jgi:phosphosulfolactate synthase|nr:phosphosulfolactate synthase [Bacillota bacterium]HAZ20816.1 phosphosulfolactate synthase [Bacillota bacterium]HBL49703.1 phosphosulfolactate synthase [Bacillota bacterium]HBR23967.1 phosphosulfolactate synthase [Bacillota bacterium]HCF93115.1 phosphosulfolactate synthase [Bacillota bacterium]
MKEIVKSPIQGRVGKPRQLGITMVMDKGLGLAETRDFLALGSEYVDFVKLAFGTAAVYPPAILQEKIALIKDSGNDVYPGGTFLEIAIIQKKVPEFLERAGCVGFTAIEVSDGTIELSAERRRTIIGMAAKAGFKVLSEVGKKDPRQKTSGRAMANAVLNDLDAGSKLVIVEGRESGRGVGIYDKEGHIEQERFEELLSCSGVQNAIIWEAPLKDQQSALIGLFGPNVNMGNIPPHEVIALESMRLGLRNDTLKSVYQRD